MGGLERQVADYHEREEEVQRLARESIQKVEDALSLKDQASAREDHSYREVNRLTDERGVMLLKRQVRGSHSSLQNKHQRVFYKLLGFIFEIKATLFSLLSVKHYCSVSVSLYPTLTLYCIVLRTMLLQADVDAACEVTRQRAAAQRRSGDESLKELSLKNAELIGEIGHSLSLHLFYLCLPYCSVLQLSIRTAPRYDLLSSTLPNADRVYFLVAIGVSVRFNCNSSLLSLPFTICLSLPSNLSLSLSLSLSVCVSPSLSL